VAARFDPADLVGGIDRHRARVDVAIGNDDKTAVEGFDQRGASLDGLYRAFDVTDLDLIASLERAPDQNQNSSQQVLQHILKGKSDGDRTDAETGENIDRVHRRQDDGHHHQKTKEQDKPVCEASQHIAEVVAIRAHQGAVYESR
jgi:hypothetical protein